MRRYRSVKELTGAVQRFRRRVMANLDARIDALWSLEDQSAEVKHARRALSRFRDVVEAMR